MDAPYRIRAWRLSDDGKNHVSCFTDDQLACRFDIEYFIREAGFSSTLTLTDRLDAEQVVRMLNVAWEEGKRDAFDSLRKLIGVK